MDNPWQLCRTIGPLTLHGQEILIFNTARLKCLEGCGTEGRVREIVLSLARHFKLFARHLIGFNYGSSPDIFKFCWTCLASPANFAYSGLRLSEEYPEPPVFI